MSDAAAQALRLLWAHKLRSALTLFGLVWGTAAVIFLVAWGDGLTVMLEDGFQRTGKDLGQVWAGRIGENFTPAVDRRVLWLTHDDALAVRARARLPEIVGAETRTYLPAAFGQRALNLEVRGVEPQSIAVRGVRIDAGRLITRADLEHRRRVLVLGHKARIRLLGPQGRIGDRVRIGGKPFELVGILARVGTQLSSDGDPIDDQAWIPITTAHANWPADWTQDFVVSFILYRLRDRSLIEETELEIRGILAPRLGVSPSDEEALFVWTPVEMLQRIPLDEQSALLFILAATTLLIGGVGTLNMMLDSVRERRQEIGLRLALGATQRDVTSQFFLETVTIVGLGGTLGIALGVAGCLALEQLQTPDLIPVPILSAQVMLLAVGVMTAVGVLAGVIPAWRAAQVDPAVTLRME